MTNKIYISILAFLFSILGYAQSDYFYYYNNNKIFLNLDRSSVTLITETDFLKSSVSTLNLKDFNLEQENLDTNYKFSKTEFQQTPNIIEYFQKINLLNSNSKIIKANPNFTNTIGQKFGLSNYLYIKLKNSSDYQLLVSKSQEKNIVIVEQNQFMPLWFTLKITKNTIENTLEVANQLYETGLFASCQPDFLSDDRFCSNDPLFGSLWGLNNSTNPNHDINVCQAWNITQGANVNVAVLDQGIFKTHIDLFSNIHPLSYNSETNTSPSQLFGDHGTHCAGTIAAIKDNNIQVVGVAPLSKLMDVSNSLAGTPNSRIKRADGINWAWQNGADIISNSWGSGVQYQVIDDAINNAIQNGRNGKGTIIVFATGNNSGAVSYPANSNPNILSVGAMTSSGIRSNFSNFGNQLDVVAPGSSILSTISNNQTASWDGTSMATPHVAGVAALILSVNSCLTAQQVRDIIEQTAQKVGGYSYTTTTGRPNGTWNNQMGYGLVDAYAAVQMAQSMGSTTLDLMVKDGLDDIGDEPNNITQYMWASTDIWIRNNDDNGLEHQNPEYHPTNPNYAYIRVTNKSCVPTNSNEILKFYWAKAGSSLAWPESWDGNNYFSQGPLLGAPVGQVTIPVLQAGQETIVKIPFLVPNPTNYNWFQGWEQWHFCLLARIEATSDPLIETTDLYTNVKNNNGIAWKNVTIVDVEANVTTGTIAVGNPFNTPRTFFLEFVIEDLETGKPIFEEAEVSIKMDDILFNAWERGGKEAQLLDSTLEEKRKIVKGNNVILDNIAFNANEVGSLTLVFNFLTKELTEKPKFKYHVVQRDALTGNIIGGETYEIKKKTRSLFEAIAPDKVVDLNQAITISAEDINEPAIYNWYDNEGNLIYQGKDLQIASAVAEKFKLEVISVVDGFKDYKEVEVTLKPSTLENITPNPATNNITVSYKLNGVNSAYLMVLGYYGSNGTSNNYILDINSSQTNLNVSNYPSGFYTVALVVNGVVVDAKTLIKQ
jgi:subtilisin family serine protease